MSVWEVIMRVAGAVLALALVLVSAWLLLRWIGGKVPGISGGSSRLIQVLDRLPVGKNAAILLLRVQDKVMLVAVGEHGAQKLYEMDDPDGTVAPSKPPQAASFSAVLKDAAKQFKNQGDKGEGH